MAAAMARVRAGIARERARLGQAMHMDLLHTLSTLRSCTLATTSSQSMETRSKSSIVQLAGGSWRLAPGLGAHPRHIGEADAKFEARRLQSRTHEAPARRRERPRERR